MPGAVRKYVPKSERDLPDMKQAVFMLKTLTATERARLQDDLFTTVGVGGSRSIKMHTHSNRVETVRTGLADWRNLMHPETGQPVPYTGKPEDVDMLPDAIITELAAELTAFASLTEEQEKN